jgi:hypothetical protein
MHYNLRLTIPALALLLLVAVWAPTPAEAQAQVNGQTILDIPWEAQFPNPCNREGLFCTGNARIRFHGVTDATDNLHLAVHLRNQDTHCVGVESGTEYLWLDGENARVNGFFTCDGTACSLTSVRNMRWISAGPEANFRQQLRTTLVLDANGEVRLDEEIVSLSCE